jgi:A/G-specific adenine glycosylase
MASKATFGANAKAIVTALARWYASNARDLPWRREPDCRNPYCVYVSEIMLQQTQVKTVVPYWERWMRALPDIASLAKARQTTLHKLWEGLGYYTRVRNMRRAARIILQEHRGEFPRAFEEVLALPGIGRYTAGAICSIAFNQPRPVLDGNVTRVLARLFAIRGDPHRREVSAKLWHAAEDLVERAQAGRERNGCSRLNQALMELGAVICTPTRPRCDLCPVRERCAAHRLGQEEELPGRTPRIPATARRFIAIVAHRNGRVLVRQRPPGVVNAHLWELPNLEVKNGDPDAAQAARVLLGVAPEKLEPLGTIKHSITRYRITLEAFRATGVAARVGGATKGRWLNPARIQRLAFSSAHRRILTQFKAI